MGLEFKAPCKYTLSANEIRVFSECPRKRYYSSRDCLAIRSNTPRKALILGSAFHSALEYYYKTIDSILAKKFGETGYKFNYDDVLEVYDSIEKFPLTKQEIDENGEIKTVPIVMEADYKTLVNMLNCYIPQLLTDLVDYEVIACESNFNIDNWPIDDVMYHGLIDMIVRKRDDDKYYYFEHKTCTNFRPEIYSRFDIQLHLYGYYGALEYGENFGGIVLNQVKKAKTDRGYANDRKTFSYSLAELEDFRRWLTQKTLALTSPDNIHAPCNNYMSCKMCEYADICLKYGYEVPKTSVQITEDASFVDGTEKPLYSYCPRESAEETENE